MNKEFYKGRHLFYLGLIIFIWSVFVLRLFYIQVIDNRYILASDNISIRNMIIIPARGLVYDRNQKLLVNNEPVFDIMVIAEQVFDIDTVELCSMLGITKQVFISRMREADSTTYIRMSPFVFEKQVPVEAASAFREKLYKFPGFFVQERTQRKYPHPIAAHTLGYIGEVNERHLNNDAYYQPGDYIGISGLEHSYEAILRGRKGVRKQLRDRYNRIKGSYMDGKYDVEARAGEDLYTSIDVELQLLGESLMQNKIGSIVAIEPSTGEILALVTSPTYDPNLLTGRQRNKMYAQLLLDDLNPLMHRALQGTYPPGSTFKIVNALIGEQMGVLYPEKKYSCAGAFRLGGLTVGCHSHYSPLNLAGSIQHSCNTYYCWAFRDMIDKNNFPDTRTGFNEWRRQVVSFGFGSSFVSDLPYMNPGTIPYAENYDNQHGKNRWSALSIISLAIGQGEITVTPVHLANLCAIIANKGYYYMPHIVKAVGAPEHLLQKYAPIHTAIDPAYFDVIIEGMHLVTIAGTATNARIDSIEVCGKTGTAQNPHGENHSLFIAFAPKEDPKIAIAVVVENAGYGSTWAAPIASLIMEKYLKGAVKREYLVKYIENTTLLHKRKKKI